MTFDPNKFLTQPNTTEKSFNPDEFLIEDLSPDEQAVKQYQEQQAKFGGTANEALAGLAGAARGATLGLSDIALTESGLVKPETLKGLEEASPILSTVGQLGGGLIAAGPIGELASALTKGAGVLGSIAGTAIEGGIFGAGNALSDSALGDPNLNAQKIAAHIGTGALFGAGLGALGETVKAVLPKASEAALNAVNKIKTMVSKSDEAAIPLLENAAPDWSAKIKAGLEYGAEGPSIKARELVKNLDELHTSSKKAAKALYEEAAPANIGHSLEEMPLEIAKINANNTINNAKKVLSGLDEITGLEVQPLSSAASKSIIDTAIDRLEAGIFKAKTAHEVQDALSSFAKDIDSKKIIKFDKLPTAAQMADQDVLLKFRNVVRGDLKNPELWGSAATHYSEVSDAYSAYKNSLNNFRKSFMKAETGPMGIKKYVIDPGKVQSFFNKFDDVSQDLKKQYLNEFINQTENLAKASENYHGYIKGAKSISDYVSDLSHKNEELGKIAQVMASKGPTGSMLSEIVFNPYKQGATLNSSFNKLKTIGEIVKKTTDSIQSSSKSIFTGNNIRTISSGIVGISEKQYNKNANRIHDLSNNLPELNSHLEKTTENLYESAPNISSGIHSTITKGIQFLNTKLPKPSNELPLNAKWEPTPSQKAKFNKYYNAVNDPISALKQVKNGTLSNETMEALQAVHPELLHEMQLKVVENMVPQKLSKLNYATKISLSKFLGKPLESSMLPKVFMANQISFSLPSPQQNGSKTRPSKAGMGKMNISSRTMTRVQQMERDSK